MRWRKGWAAAVAVAAGVLLAAFLLGDPGSGGGGSERERLGSSLAGISRQARAQLRQMSLGEKVDQLFLVGFAGREATARGVVALRRRPPGGVFVASRNWADAGQGRALIEALRSGPSGASLPLPPLIATAQEGGPYRHLRDLPPTERAIDVGDSGSARRALRWARNTARVLREAGIDVNLAPVADVAALDSPIGDRAFGDDPDLVAAMTAAAVQGCRAGGTLCAVGHFPGVGAASQDTALGPATVGLPLPDLIRRDLPPFEGAAAARVPAMVVANAVYAAYDGVTPAALEPAIATDLLRARLGFRGVAITDDLGAGAITAERSAGEAAVAALRAGADLLFFRRPGRGASGARQAVLQAVRRGELSPARIAQAAARVLDLKRLARRRDA
jgi:beta-N-acetylhexosaminidase